MAKFISAESPKCNTSTTSKASKGQWWEFELLAESLVWHPGKIIGITAALASIQHQSSIVCDSGRDPGPVVVMWGYMKYFLASVTSDHNLAPVTIRWSPITPFTHSNIVIISKMSLKLLIQNKSKISEDQIWNCKTFIYIHSFIFRFRMLKESLQANALSRLYMKWVVRPTSSHAEHLGFNVSAWCLPQ